MGYPLRWRFDFSDSKPTRVGEWDVPHSHDPQKMAAFVNKENLRRAAIEALDVDDEKLFTIAECDGHEFANFKWVARMVMNDEGVTHELMGLMLVTANEQITVFRTGAVHVEPRTEEDKNFHYEGYGR